MFQKKPSASEVDGVQYRRAKTWQIICYACNALVGMSVYSLIGMASDQYACRLIGTQKLCLGIQDGSGFWLDDIRIKIKMHQTWQIDSGSLDGVTVSYQRSIGVIYRTGVASRCIWCDHDAARFAGTACGDGQSSQYSRGDGKLKM